MEKENPFKVELCDSLKTPLCCDCVYYCPSFEENPLLVVGLYELNENENITKGGFCLYLIKNRKLELCFDEIFNAGLLDLKCVLFSNKFLLVCGCNDGKLRVYQIKSKNVDRSLLKSEQILEISFEEGSKCLYVDTKISENELWVLCSCEINFVCVMKISTDLNIVYKEIIRSHEYTPWVCCFSEETHNIFLSGGDDMRLILYDLRSENTENRIVQINKKTHNMGISALKFARNNINNFFSGSFDQNLRLWDIRNLKSPIWESYRNGGIWRIVEGETLLGLGLSFSNEFELIKNDQNPTVESIATLKEHESLAYGIDIYKDEWLATCSFYDKKLCLWNLSK